MKGATLIAAAVAMLAAFLGCATTGEIPVAIDHDQAIYISPANEDGIQDAVTLDLLVTPLERTRVVSYQVVVSAASGAVVVSQEQSIPRSGFFARLFGRDRRESVEPPEVVLWDGRDARGAYVPDGTYTLSVTVADNRGNTGASGPQQIIVDNTPPFVALSAPYTLFTPDGDDILDILPVYQRRSTREDRWVGEMIDESGQSVRTFTWQGGARDFIWDGTTDAGTPAAEGTYTYRVSATDRAGNTGRYELPGIVLERDPRPAVVSLTRRAFSPNNSGRADTIGIRPRAEITENLEGWRVEIRNAAGETVRTFTGPGEPVPFNYDGKDEGGITIPDGVYRAVLTLTYRGGQTPQTTSDPFTSDTTPPQATVRLSASVFSPDGDGQRDTVEVLQSSSKEREWIGTLTSPDGEVIRTVTWEGRVENFVWDGTDAQGAVLPDGVYTYTLTAEDEAENVARPITARVRIDTRPTPVRITASEPGFSPNGDGILDTVGFNLALTVRDGIDAWTVSILNAAGTKMGTIASGTELPQRISWDGRVDGALVRDGQYLAELEVRYEKGNVSTGRSGAVRVDTTPPEVIVGLSPPLFSPDDDGIDDLLSITITARDLSPIARWQADIYDPAGTHFVGWSGTGTPRTPLRWNGLSADGELVQSAEDYRLVVRATDSVWNTGEATATIPVDILVIREGDRYRIRISSIYFVPYTADYTNLEPEQARRNLETLDRLAVVLQKYPHHTIRVEGHAVQVLWENPQRAATEQSEVLLPLSLARAEAIREALVRRGIAAGRMTTAGYGGALPVVPHSDLENRWKNRRVEFILERR